MVLNASNIISELPLPLPSAQAPMRNAKVGISYFGWVRNLGCAPNLGAAAMPEAMKHLSHVAHPARNILIQSANHNNRISITFHAPGGEGEGLQPAANSLHAYIWPRADHCVSEALDNHSMIVTHNPGKHSERMVHHFPRCMELVRSPGSSPTFRQPTSGFDLQTSKKNTSANLVKKRENLCVWVVCVYVRSVCVYVLCVGSVYGV